MTWTEHTIYDMLVLSKKADVEDDHGIVTVSATMVVCPGSMCERKTFRVTAHKQGNAVYLLNQQLGSFIKDVARRAGRLGESHDAPGVSDGGSVVGGDETDGAAQPPVLPAGRAAQAARPHGS